MEGKDKRLDPTLTKGRKLVTVIHSKQNMSMKSNGLGNSFDVMDNAKVCPPIKTVANCTRKDSTGYVVYWPQMKLRKTAPSKIGCSGYSLGDMSVQHKSVGVEIQSHTRLFDNIYRFLTLSNEIE